MFGLMMLLAAATGYYVPISPHAENKLHQAARSQVQEQQNALALALYKTAAEHGQHSRSHLLLALHLQRSGASEDMTRDAFRQGVTFHRYDAQLVRKLDSLIRALALLERLRPLP